MSISEWKVRFNIILKWIMSNYDLNDLPPDVIAAIQGCEEAAEEQAKIEEPFLIRKNDAKTLNQRHNNLPPEASIPIARRKNFAKFKKHRKPYRCVPCGCILTDHRKYVAHVSKHRRERQRNTLRKKTTRQPKTIQNVNPFVKMEDLKFFNHTKLGDLVSKHGIENSDNVIKYLFNCRTQDTKNEDFQPTSLQHKNKTDQCCSSSVNSDATSEYEMEYNMDNFEENEDYENNDVHNSEMYSKDFITSEIEIKTEIEYDTNHTSETIARENLFDEETNSQECRTPNAEVYQIFQPIYIACNSLVQNPSSVASVFTESDDIRKDKRKKNKWVYRYKTVRRKSSKEKQPWVCKTCNKEFDMKCRMVKHEETHRKKEEKEKQSWICKTCNKEFNMKCRMVKHEEAHRKKEEKEKKKEKWTCTVCGKNFSMQCRLVKHEEKHKNPKPAKKIRRNDQLVEKCKICGKTYFSKCGYKNHMKRHGKEKTELCSFCGKSFYEKKFLLDHLRIHSEERPFKCSFCETAFKTRQARYSHEARHTGSQQTICSLCGFSFKSSASLRSHIKSIHENIRPYGCHLCETKFKTTSTLKYHLKTHDNPNSKHRSINRDIDPLKAAAKRRHKMPPSKIASITTLVSSSTNSDNLHTLV